MPVPADTVDIGSMAVANTVTLNAAATIAGLSITSPNADNPTLILNGGANLVLTGPGSVGPGCTLSFQNGTIGGTGTLTIDGTMNWSGGTMTGGGTTNFNTPVSATATSNYITFDNRLVNNSSTFTYSGSPYYMQIANGTIFNNNSAAIFDMQNDTERSARAGVQRSLDLQQSCWRNAEEERRPRHHGL